MAFEYDDVKAILQKHGCWGSNLDAKIELICENMDGECYQDLFHYYTSMGPDGMPYGTAKARTGDPDQWIFDRLERLFL
jgi:hypothetical protein